MIWVVRFKIESVITFGVEFFRSLVPTWRIILSGDLRVIDLIRKRFNNVEVVSVRFAHRWSTYILYY